MSFLAKVGAHSTRKWITIRNISAVVWGSLCLSVKPGSWSRPVRDVLGRQVLFTGFEALGITLIIAVLTGVSVVTQTQVFLNKIGQSAMLGPILVTVILRELGPLLVNLIVIARSGSAMAAELATMRVRNEVNVLDDQGIDPMVYLVMPRILGVVASVLSLTVIFAAVSFGSGYLFGRLMGITSSDPSLFYNSVLGAITPKDVLNLLAKTIIPGMATGAICCVNGLSIRNTATQIPVAATLSVVRSIITVLIVSAIVSVLTYI